MALSADRELEMKDQGGVRKMLATASTAFYKGALVCIDPATGLCLAAADTANYLFMGIVKEAITTGAGGGEYVELWTKGVFKLPATSLEAADGGKLLDITDDEAITDAGTNSVVVGRCIEVLSATSAWVEIHPGIPAGVTAS